MKLLAKPSITSDASDGFVLGGMYDKKRKKIIWHDYSKRKNSAQQISSISNVLFYTGLSSPFIMVTVIRLIRGGEFFTMKDILGGSLKFWLITFIFALLIGDSFLFKLRNYTEQGDLITISSVIIEKNIITSHLDRVFRHNIASGGVVSSILSKVPYLQWLFVFSIMGSFIWFSYQATNDLSINYVGKTLFYIFFIILLATVIIILQLVLPLIFLLIQQEKKLNLAIKSLDSEQLKIDLDKAEQFYKEHQVSKAGIKRYLSEYRKLLKEKEMKDNTR